ncbi:MAG: M20 family metallopeptidase [Chloroflexota bacterium]
MNREQVSGATDKLIAELIQLSDWLAAHPELGEQEFQAADRLVALLAGHGFAVERGLAGLPTSFVATYETGPGGPAVGFMAEYDALPEIGHACGHNIIGASCAGAAIVLKEIWQGRPGTIKVFGCPAEETIGGKIAMAEAGLFNGLAAAMSFHPGPRTAVGGSSLATHPVEMVFHGKPAHAAAAPQEGRNALDAAVEAYTAIRTLKNHLRDDARVPGIIVKGGSAANVVPDHTIARYSLRAADVKYLEYVIERVQDCGRAAALATGTTVEFSYYEPLFTDLRQNQVLVDRMKSHLEALGETVTVNSPTTRGGSTDVGNVSYVCPAIHPSIDVGGAELKGHTREFAAACVSDTGHRGLRRATEALALLALDVLGDADFRAAVQRSFEEQMKQ